MIRFDVTYEIWDDEAVDDSGFECEGVRLRDAIDAVRQTRTSAVDGVESIEPSDSRIEQARWITITNGMEFETGAREARSLHIPDCVTGASRRRIARLLGI